MLFPYQSDISTDSCRIGMTNIQLPLTDKISDLKLNVSLYLIVRALGGGMRGDGRMRRGRMWGTARE